MHEGKPGPFSEGEVFKVAYKSEDRVEYELHLVGECIKDTAENLIKPQKRSGRQCRRC
jgi:hypothetical protein